MPGGQGPTLPTLHCGVDAIDPKVGELPGWRGGRKTGEFFSQSRDIGEGEDNLITVVALQEASLVRGRTKRPISTFL